MAESGAEQTPAPASAEPPGTSSPPILATLVFLADSPIYRTEKPFEIIGLPSGEVPDDQKSNLVYETETAIHVTDARSSPEPLLLDTNGFTWLRHHSSHLSNAEPFTSVDKDRGTVDAFLHETINMTKDATDASNVYVYDWRYRKSGTIYNDRDLEEDVKNTRYLTYAPISYVHSDYSYQGGLDRLFLHLTGPELEAYRAKQRRIRLINAWRPLKRVERDPLAVCDRRSVRPEDVIEVDKVLPNNLELETCTFYRPYHKWYHLSGQTPEDVLLFVQWEEFEAPSETTSVPHASLGGPQATVGEMARESIEVRMIVIS